MLAIYFSNQLHSQWKAKSLGKCRDNSRGVVVGCRPCHPRTKDYCQVIWIWATFAVQVVVVVVVDDGVVLLSTFACPAAAAAAGYGDRRRVLHPLFRIDKQMRDYFRKFFVVPSWTNGWTMIVIPGHLNHEEIWILSANSRAHFMNLYFGYSWERGVGALMLCCVVLCSLENKRTIRQRICKIWVIIGFRSRELLIPGNRKFPSSYLQFKYLLPALTFPTYDVSHSFPLGTGFKSLRMNSNEHSQAEMQH